MRAMLKLHVVIVVIDDLDHTKQVSKGLKYRWLTLRYFFVKDAVAQGHVDIKRVDTKKNAADGFTKAIDLLTFLPSWREEAGN
jgi:hypothetical protein